MKSSIRSFMLFLVGGMASFSVFAQDDCASAVVVTDLTGTNCTTSAPSSTNALGAGSCEEGTLDTWFQFTAQGPTADITVSNNISGWRPEYLVVSGTPASTCAGYTQESCSDANGNYNSLTTTGIGPLNIGETYWIVVSSNGNSTSGTITVCVDNPAPGPCQDNEDCGSPLTITLNAVDGSAACVTDCNTSASAGPDFAGTNCYDLPNETVWYEITVDGTASSIDIDLTSTDLSSPEFTVFQTADCINYTIIDCQEGSSGAASTTSLGVTGGATYLIAVSDVTGNVGNFDLCVTQYSAGPANCIDNEDCSNAATITLNGPGNAASCITDCNTGASPGIDFTTTTCSEMLNPTVWYTFTTSTGTATIDVNLTSTDFSDPEFAIFSNTICNPTSWITVACNEGTGGSSSLTSIGVAENTTYFIVVSDSSGDEGNFDLCITENPDNSACNTDNTLEVTATSMGSPFTGPFEPGEVVTFCYTINTFTTGLPSDPQGCNYLQGIVPTFGDCWDPVSFDASGMPTVTTSLTAQGTISDAGGCTGPVAFQDPWCGCVGTAAGTWSWYPAGTVDYNLSTSNPMGYTTGDDVGAGWFFITNYNSSTGACGVSTTDPDNSYGDNDFPFCNDLSGWQVCFQLQVKDVTACGLGETDCNVSVKTFADGEIGIWSNIGCTADLPTNVPGAINCVLPIELGALSGSYENHAAVIRWTTLSEENVSHFEIDHITAYGEKVTIGKIPAAGFSQEEIDYQFIDRTPNPGINYYNLRAVDNDGSGKNHGIVSIKATFGFATYDQEKKEIVLSGIENIEVYTLEGAKVLSSEGKTRIPFDKSGIFMVRDTATGVVQRVVTY